MPNAPFTPSVKYARAHYCASLAIGQPTQAQHNANAAEFDRMIADVIRDAKAEARAEIVADLRAKFGVTNRAADYLTRASSPSESEA